MKVIIIHIGNIYVFPPVISLINILEEIGINTLVITTVSDFTKKHYKNIRFIELPFDYEKTENVFVKFINMYRIRNRVNIIIDENYNQDTVLWITNNVSIKHLSFSMIKNKKYILQQMELSKHILYHPMLPFKMNIKKIANNSAAIVVPEYNRACITKVWWDLKELPYVLPNKPYNFEKINKNSEIKDEKAKRTINELKGKKIILYQGILNEERPINVFMDAIESMGDEYAFVVMSGDEEYFNKYRKDNCYFIPYIAPPGHLEITSNAYIGVLTYTPAKNEFSPLNAIYCAPNKIFEYGMFGIPMIGNNIPGLKYTFSEYNCGVCFEDYTMENIKSAIHKVEKEYEKYRIGSEEMFNMTDNVSTVKSILEEVKKG